MRNFILDPNFNFFSEKNADFLTFFPPKKKTKKQRLTKEERTKNRKLSSERVLNENVIGMLKRFKIISDRYRNRRKRFGLRFNLIAGIYNFELS